MRTFEFSDNNGEYGGASIILSAVDFSDALRIMDEMVVHLHDFTCDNQKGEDEEDD
jgi:hypothetical protein